MTDLSACRHTDRQQLRSGVSQENPDPQIDTLLRAGVARANIHTDVASGAKASRPKLDPVSDAGAARARSPDSTASPARCCTW